MDGTRSPSPGLLRSWAFRTGLIYLLLYATPLLAGMLPGVSILAGAWYHGLALAARWALIQVLGFSEHSPAPPVWYIDHRPEDLVQLVGCILLLAIAMLSAAVWTILPRTASPRGQLLTSVHTIARFTLAGVMIGYGWSKLFPQQFNGGQVPLSWLVWRLGDMTPQHLLWVYMGYSRPYTIFTGAGEMLGAILVCSRRTSTLGALVLIAVLSNVVAINFAYDVPVKVESVHLLLLALFVAAPDARRLAAFFLSGAPTREGPQVPSLDPARTRKWLEVAGATLAVWLLVAPLPGIAENIGGLSFRRSSLPRYGGVYLVEQPSGAQVDSGGPAPPWSRWRQLVLTRRGATAVLESDSLVRYNLVADTVVGRLELTTDRPDPLVLSYELLDEFRMRLRLPGPDNESALILRRTEPALLRWEHRWGW